MALNCDLGQNMSNVISSVLNLDLISEIGSGGFGTVFKAIDKLADQVYAVKIINFNDTDSIDKVLREVKTLAKINGSQVVRYNHSLIENNCVFIKMEFCSTNLTNLLKVKAKCFGRQTSDPMNVLDYHISYRLFREVVECVQYLHELDPPIIHRDLKPQNILATNEPVNGRYLKLCDFGLATFHEKESISHTSHVGTPKYKAPEVCSSRKYGSKADIYSLGVIGQEIFDFDINESDCFSTENNDLREKLNGLTKLFVSMIEYLIIKRPESCAEVLNQYRYLSFTSGQLNNYPEYPELSEMVFQSDVKIFVDYLIDIIEDPSENTTDLRNNNAIESNGINQAEGTDSFEQIVDTGKKILSPLFVITNKDNEEDSIRIPKKVVKDFETIGKRVKEFINRI